jgi:hypothetical protein
LKSGNTWNPQELSRSVIGLLYISAKKAAEGSLCVLAGGTVIDIGICSFMPI